MTKIQNSKKYDLEARAFQFTMKIAIGYLVIGIWHLIVIYDLS